MITRGPRETSRRFVFVSYGINVPNPHVIRFCVENIIYVYYNFITIEKTV